MVPTFPYRNELRNGRYVEDKQYTWGAVAEVVYTSGTPGQNNPKPASLFRNHQIVYVPSVNAWYDPSYGIKYDSLQAIDNSLSGFVTNGVNDFYFQKNPVGVQIEFK